MWVHHSQHRSHWGPSTVRTGPPEPRPSGWSSSCDWSTPSGRWCTALACMHPEHWQTDGTHWRHEYTVSCTTHTHTHTHKPSSPNLGPARRQPGVPPDTTHEVELALSVATQVDGPRGDVDVHEVVDDPALDVVLDPVHQVPAAHVEDLNVRQVPADRENTDEGWSCRFSVSQHADFTEFYWNRASPNRNRSMVGPKEGSVAFSFCGGNVWSITSAVSSSEDEQQQDGESTYHYNSFGTTWSYTRWNVKTEPGPVLVVVQGQIGQLVTFDPLEEVGHSFLFVTVCVVWTAQLHLLFEKRQNVNLHKDVLTNVCQFLNVS